MARLQGIGERKVLRRYVLRNALAPSVQIFALSIQYLFGGVIVTESVFATRARQQLVARCEPRRHAGTGDHDHPRDGLHPHQHPRRPARRGAGAEAEDAGVRRRLAPMFAFAATGRGRVGLVILFVVLAAALFGPFFAPHDPAAIIGAPGSPPGHGALLGTDYLGHDVLSRTLWGGRSVLWLSLTATALAYAAGWLIGLVAGYNRNLLDPLLMRPVDVDPRLPAAAVLPDRGDVVGTSKAVLILGVAIVLAPGSPGSSTRRRAETRSAATSRPRSPAARRPSRSCAREIVPNIMGPLIANMGLSLTFAILLVAAVKFLNLGLQPPGRQLGADDRREPARAVAQRLVHRRAGGADRRADDRREPRGRRRLAHARALRADGEAVAAVVAGEPLGTPAELLMTRLRLRCLRARGLGADASSSPPGEPVVEDVSLALRAGEALGLVGESGSGKTTTALALLGYARAGMRIARRQVRSRAGGSTLHDEAAARRDARAARLPRRRRTRPPTSTRRCGRRLHRRRPRDDGARAHRARRRSSARSAACICRRRREFAPALPAPALGRPAAARADRVGARAASRR